MFQTTKKLSSSSFADVYQGLNLITGNEVAIKIEKSSIKKSSLLLKEIDVYQNLLNESALINRIPNIIRSSTKDNLNILVMDLLGPNLEDLLIKCNRNFSLKTVLMIGIQILEIIEAIHKKKYLHRDIKPTNILIGRGKFSHQIYLIDFGLAKCYIQENGKHIPYREDKPFKGTYRYSSITSHFYIEQGRRDDLESIGYILIYLYKGLLPWQGLKSKELIIKSKISTTIEELCKDLPHEFEIYLQYTRNLKFAEPPDYDYLKKLFSNSFQKLGFEFNYMYDWIFNTKEKEKLSSDKKLTQMDSDYEKKYND